MTHAVANPGICHAPKKLLSIVTTCKVTPAVFQAIIAKECATTVMKRKAT
jgi:hypothetical protein